MTLDESKTFVDFPLASYNELSSSYLLVSQLSGDKQCSFKIKTSDLSKQILQDYLRNSELKSMAFEDERAYAKTYHDHDIYTSAYWHQQMNGEDLHCLLRIDDVTHNQTFEVSASQKHDDSKDEYKKYAKNRISSLQPKLGEVMFNANAKSICIDQDDANFAGWLPADGQWYDINKFTLSNDFSNVFLVQNRRVQVPSIQYFIKFNVSLNANVTHYEYRTCLPVHSHPYNGSTPRGINVILNENDNWGMRSGKFQGGKTVVIDTYKNAQEYGSHIHNGKLAQNKQVEVHSVTCQVPLDQNIFNGSNVTTKFNNYTGSQETYPSHVTLSAFVYVGRSYKSAQLVDF